MRFVVFWVATSALLAACGGSDDNPAGGIPGSGDPVKSYLAPANYVSVAQKVLQTHAYVLNTTDLVLGIYTADPEAQAQLLHQPLRRFSHLPATVFDEQAVGVVQVQEQPCFGGGKQVLDYNDANNNGVEDAGDSVSLSAQACSWATWYSTARPAWCSTAGLATLQPTPMGMRAALATATSVWKGPASASTATASGLWIFLP